VKRLLNIESGSASIFVLSPSVKHASHHSINRGLPTQTARYDVTAAIPDHACWRLSETPPRLWWIFGLQDTQDGKDQSVQFCLTAFAPDTQ
jgi:hypothetical protein